MIRPFGNIITNVKVNIDSVSLREIVRILPKALPIIEPRVILSAPIEAEEWSAKRCLT